MIDWLTPPHRSPARFIAEAIAPSMVEFGYLPAADRIRLGVDRQPLQGPLPMVVLDWTACTMSVPSGAWTSIGEFYRDDGTGKAELVDPPPNEVEHGVYHSGIVSACAYTMIARCFARDEEIPRGNQLERYRHVEAALRLTHEVTRRVHNVCGGHACIRFQSARPLAQGTGGITDGAGIELTFTYLTGVFDDVPWYQGQRIDQVDRTITVVEEIMP